MSRALVALVVGLIVAGCGAGPTVSPVPTPVESLRSAAPTGPAAPPSPTAVPSRAPTSGPVPADGPSSLARIDEAVATGRIDPADAVLYRVFAVFDDPRLPGEYRSDVPIPDGTAVVGEAADAYATLDPARQALLAPFLVPPYVVGSWWSLRTGTTASVGAAAVSGAAVVPGAAAQPPCVPIRLNTDDCPASQEWANIDTGDGKVRLWYQKRYPNDALLVANLADEIERVIWPALTRVMGREPLSDGEWRKNGGSGALDIAFVDLTTANGLAYRYGGCDEATPGHILMDRTPTNPIQSVLAHEVMHAIQYAFPLSGTCADFRWLNEATATWAEDHVYPQLNGEHGFAPRYLTTMDLPLDRIDSGQSVLGFPAEIREYGAYLFFQYLARRGDAGVVQAIYSAAAGAAPLAAIDSVIEGGFAERWPEFALAAWNQDEWTRFADWDRLRDEASSTGYERTLFGEPQMIVRAFEGDSLEPLSAQYVSFEFEPDVSGVAWYNGLRFNLQNDASLGMFTVGAGLPPTDGLRIQALVQGDDGAWRTEDWTNHASVTFCQDRRSERVRRLVLIYSNASPDTAIPVTGERPSVLSTNLGCWKWQGRISLEAVLAARRIQVAIDVTFSRTEPFVAGGLYAGANYTVEQANITWQASGTFGGCTYSGGGSGAPWDAFASSFQTLNFIDSGPMRRAYAGGVEPRERLEYTATCPPDPPATETVGGVTFPATSDILAAPEDGRTIDGRIRQDQTDGYVEVAWHLEAVRE